MLSETEQMLFSLQLSSTKSVDGQLTLVHFIEEMVETNYPEISGFENELTHVEQAARGEETWAEKINHQFLPTRLSQGSACNFWDSKDWYQVKSTS